MCLCVCVFVGCEHQYRVEVLKCCRMHMLRETHRPTLQNGNNRKIEKNGNIPHKNHYYTQLKYADRKLI